MVNSSGFNLHQHFQQHSLSESDPQITHNWQPWSAGASAAVEHSSPVFQQSPDFSVLPRHHQLNAPLTVTSTFATLGVLLMGALSAAHGLSVESKPAPVSNAQANLEVHDAAGDDHVPLAGANSRDPRYFFLGNHQARVSINTDDVDAMIGDVMPLITSIGKLNQAFAEFEVEGRSCHIRVICESQQLSLSDDLPGDSLVARVVDALSSIQGPAILTLQKRNFPANFVQLIYNYVEASVVGKMGLDCVTGAIEQCPKSTTDFMAEKRKKVAAMSANQQPSSTEGTTKNNEPVLGEGGLVDKLVEV